ncbi:hypothetical protein PISL3812_06531 [Talaromyces islandicus]|uniref:Uncharacterized protein n=1 Tax=Talaromyces islandicus TaxID=28573 RepID=A0A0U1M1Q2_TALIS|nr:hypothetical protein PISL3812_06531 [Talaromyces islandicus]
MGNPPLPAPALGDSWVISGPDGTTNGQDRRSNSLPTDSSSQEAVIASLSQDLPLTPLSSFSESEFLADYEDPAPAISRPDISESTVSIASSGPELVMPSIMVESKSTINGSWVIPKKRSKQRLYESRKAPKMPKHRGDSPSSDEQPSAAVTEAAPVPRPASGLKQRLSQVKRHLDRTLDQNNFLRIMLNSFFLFMTLHLLIIPELLYQVPSLCQVSAASKVYTKHCSGFNETLAVSSVPSKFQSALRTQNQLHGYLNHTIQAIIPLEKPLKDNGAILRQLYTSLRTEYSGARNEIDLEFQGIWAASRSISRKFMTLKVDVEGFISNVQFQKTLSDHQRLARDTTNANTHFLWRFLSRDIPETEKQEANSLALTNQFIRLHQDLDATIARLGQKTESFLFQLAKVDDHLESMKAVLVREHQRLAQGSQDFGQMDSVWDTLKSMWSVSSNSARQNPILNDDKSLSELERISSYHGFVSDIIGKLDKELKALQKIRSIQA